MGDDERDIGLRLAQAQPDDGAASEEMMLQRVLGGVLDEPAQPLTAGRYVLLEPVGRGGVGEVYAAYDPELDRRVAIKLVHAGASAWGDVQRRMQREAKAMARVRHPNVVAIHDVGRFRDEVFIAMELLEGQTLSAWLRAETRDWPALREVFVQAARGLAAVHDAGLVLRDFKPANVFVGRDGVVKVLDFGLARAAADAGPAEPAGLLSEELTMGGAIAGTPAYMAPEQIRGGTIDAAADQFAFCVALYEALWRERPFPGTDLAQRHRAIETQRLEPPQTLPSPVRAAVLRGLAANPAERHPSMTALADALQPTPSRRTGTWLAVGLAALLSAGATAFTLTARDTEITSQMLARVDALEAEARAAAQAHHFVYPPLANPDAPTAYSRTLALELIEGPASELAQTRAMELRRTFSSRLSALGDSYAEKEGGGPFAADFYAAAVLFDADNAYARERSLLTSPQLEALRDRVQRGEFGAAELFAGASLAALAEEDPVSRRKQVAHLRHQDAPATVLANLEALVGTQPPAPRATPTPAPSPSSPASATPPAGPADTKADATPRDPVNATALAKEGLAALRSRQLERAEALLNRAVARDHRNATALGGLARFHFEMGRYAESAKFAKKAIAAAPKRARYRMILGNAYFKVLRFEEARTAYRAAKRLGAAEADKALRRVEAKLGE